ncbi:prepilin peptidase [Alienimonas californiensis]|uniref:Type 4 prepilin-like proteins leader peptide-processing enzyme n=1 Tax=Alienimonas californiensis TaxID=2527989 RepID=A0A517PD30_9PLAN|nr:A24 family peptidase [Alienimonas californiensis]QDT17283.1 Type 4 prepilin-like proteins leader peptide-processing enzyme [Alienimonas californiensis]
MSDAAWGALTALVFLAGCGAGRFVNVAAVRFGPREYLGEQLRSLWRPTPHEAAMTRGRGLSKLPVLGWFLPSHPLAAAPLRDRIRPALVELSAGALLGGLFWQEVANWRTWAPLGGPFLPDVARAFECPWDASFTFALHGAMLLSLLTASVIDLRRLLIPDGTTIPALLLAVVASLSGRLWLVPVWFEEGRVSRFAPVGARPDVQPVPEWIFEHPHLHGLAASVAGIVAGAGVCWVVRWIGARTLGREAMGLGDVILMAMVGAFVGWQPVLTVFFLAPVAALAVVVPAKLYDAATGKAASAEFPYGPWLALAAAFVVLFWQDVWPAVGPFFALGPFVLLAGLTIAVLLAVMLWLIALVKRALGIDVDHWPAGYAGWSSADTLTYLAAESDDLNRPARAPGRPARPWPGSAAGRGRLHADRWRHGGPASSSPQFRPDVRR